MIHIVSGPPCAGKSTYVREHAKDGDLRVDYDLIATALGSVNSHAADGLIKQAAFAAREGVIETALKNADDESWIIHTSPSEEHMRRYEEAGAEFIELDPGKETCLERAKEDDRPQQTIDGIENRIKAHLGECARGEGEKYKVNWKTQTRSSFDHKKFIVDHPEMDVSQYFKTTNLRPFRVTEKKGSN